jgi:hypothetical protein
MRRLHALIVVAGFGLLYLSLGCATVSDLASSAPPGEDGFTAEFNISPGDLTTTGRNAFFILEPGYQLVLEGGGEKVTITVLDETENVGDVTTRVLEEREEKRGELIEVSYNYFAISKSTGDVYYFGEAVDMYRDGVVTHHTGEWRADEGDAKAGLMMPANPTKGMKFYQEIAPGKAMDRAEVVNIDETLDTPAGVFQNCLKTKESTPLEPGVRDYKTYAPGIGMIQDESLRLIKHGFVELGD